MNKAEFLRYCETTEKGEDAPPLRVDVGNVYRELNHAVFLNGCWSRRSIVQIELYRPMPGRQYRDFLKRDRLLEEARQKFQRWLDEYLAS